jgi:hypothetical protein
VLPLKLIRGNNAQHRAQQEISRAIERIREQRYSIMNKYERNTRPTAYDRRLLMDLNRREA